MPPMYIWIKTVLCSVFALQPATVIAVNLVVGPNVCEPDVKHDCGKTILINISFFPECTTQM